MRQFGIDRNGADCDVIRPVLKSIDSLFDICFNYDTEQYIIFFNDAPFQSVPWKELDKNTIEHVKKMFWINLNGDPFKAIDENNLSVELAKENEKNDLIREMSKDLRKAIIKDS